MTRPLLFLLPLLIQVKINTVNYVKNLTHRVTVPKTFLTARGILGVVHVGHPGEVDALHAGKKLTRALIRAVGASFDVVHSSCRVQRRAAAADRHARASKRGGMLLRYAATIAAFWTTVEKSHALLHYKTLIEDVLCSHSSAMLQFCEHRIVAILNQRGRRD